MRSLATARSTTIVEKPVEMALSDARLDPLHEPPEADDPDPVVLGHVRGHEVDGRPHAGFNVASENVSRSTTTSLLRSGCRRFTHISPRSRCETPS